MAAATLFALLGTAACGSDDRILTGDDTTGGGGTGGELPDETSCWSDLDCEEGQTCDLTEASPITVDEGCHAPPREVGTCVPRPRRCGEGELPDGDCVLACEVPPASSIEPVERWSWSGDHVINLPILTQLDDDDCDGKVTDRDLPDLIFTSFNHIWYRDGIVHAMSIVDGDLVEKWSSFQEEDPVFPSRQLAAGDLDGAPGAEIVACTETGRVRALHPDGSVMWTSDHPTNCYAPSLVDLDRDGQAEVVTSWYVYEGRTGAIRHKLDPQELNARTVVVSHLDADGDPEIVGPDRVYSSEGDELARVNLPYAKFLAVGDLDADGVPEIVSVSTDIAHDVRHLHVWQYDPAAPNGGVILRQNVEIHGPNGPFGCTNDGGGGPPILADLDGDGNLDVGVPGRTAYTAFDGLALLDPQIADEDAVLWREYSHDCSSGAAGAAVFDLDGDGETELIHADHHYLRVRDSASGELLDQQCNSNGTALDHPLLADVDHDGHAEIVVVTNDYNEVELACPDDGTRRRGIRIFEAPEDDWRSTETIWNQHGHHVTNVLADGRIPVGIPAFWADASTNAFRRPWPHPTPLAPNLVISGLRLSCADEEVRVTVRNVGESPAPAGVEVVLQAEDEPASVWATTTTPERLAPLEEVDVVLPLTGAPEAVLAGLVDLEAVIDPAPQDHDWAECRTGDNARSRPVSCTMR